jgi:alpha-maltose-1-phosphate synthase
VCSVLDEPNRNGEPVNFALHRNEAFSSLPTGSAKPADSPLRVLHLATVPFRPEEGVSRAVTALAGKMNGIESYLVADKPVGVEFLGHHVVQHWKPGRLLASGELSAVLHRIRPDVVHLHGGILATSLALSRSLRSVPVVTTIYQLLPVPLHELGIKKFFDARKSSIRPGRIAASALVGLPLARSLLKHGGIEAVCTPDPRVADALRGFGPVVMAQGGASLSERRAQWSSTPVVGFAGRAEPGRGVEELVEAVGLLQKRIPGIRLRLLLLPGPAANRWKVTFGTRPYVDLSVGVQPDLSAELARCQVVALPFRIPATITPPLVASEAMAVGVPVVANSLSCITPLLKHGMNGMLASDASAGALATAIGSVLQNEQTWASLSGGARDSIQKDWSWTGAAAATVDAYQIAIERRRGREESTVRKSNSVGVMGAGS